MPSSQTIAFPARIEEKAAPQILRLCSEAIGGISDELFIDLSSTTFLTPFGVVVLAGTVKEAMKRGRSVRYRRPSMSATQKFLSKIGFDKFIQVKEVDHRVFETEVQLQRIRAVEPLLADRILQLLMQYLNVSERVEGSLKMSVIEMMTNAIDHSWSQEGCYVCAQAYRSLNVIRLCVADFGIGILDSLRTDDKYKHLPDSLSAIREAVKEGVSSRKGGGNGGKGLTHIQRFLEVNEGDLTIISGDGQVTWTHKKSSCLETMLERPFQGTIVCAKINADKEGFYFLTGEVTEEDIL